MKQQWDKTHDLLADFQAEFAAFLSAARLKPNDYKMAMQLKKTWEKAGTAVEDFSGFVSDIQPVMVKLPESKEFAEKWKFWKDYLIEQHGTHMRSRWELVALKTLSDISDGDPKKMCDNIDWFINKRYRSFFDNRGSFSNNSKEKGANNDPDW